MKAKEYFKKEYGKQHIELVSSLDDYTSLYDLIDEFAEQYHKAKLKELEEKLRGIISYEREFEFNEMGEWCMLSETEIIIEKKDFESLLTKLKEL